MAHALLAGSPSVGAAPKAEVVAGTARSVRAAASAFRTPQEFMRDPEFKVDFSLPTPKATQQTIAKRCGRTPRPSPHRGEHPRAPPARRLSARL